MPPEERPNPDPRAAMRLAAWVRAWLVWLLLGSYALAAILPGPGLWLHQLGGGGSVASVRFSLVMVAILLVCGAVSIDPRQLREVLSRPAGAAVALAWAWAPPLLVVVFWGSVSGWWLDSAASAGLTVGLAMAAAMPVANSAVAWTHQSGGSLAWALGLVVLSICVCPWVTPVLMQLMGLTLSSAEAADAQQLMGRFSGITFVTWVVGPTLVGFALRRVAGRGRVESARAATMLASSAALLLLNYANAATALPAILAEPDWRLLATTVVAAATLPISGVLPAWRAGGLVGLSRRARLAWAYSLAMKNTGLALGLAGATLTDQPVVVLVILTVTLTQHVVAGSVHRYGSLARARAPER